VVTTHRGSFHLRLHALWNTLSRPPKDIECICGRNDTTN
jgi:hypothetical protein